jgi:hypothetical protein
MNRLVPTSSGCAMLLSYCTCQGNSHSNPPSSVWRPTIRMALVINNCRAPARDTSMGEA